MSVGSSVYFSGVDMLDGTPVLDIKPYIPQYDNPLNLGHACNSTDKLHNSNSQDGQLNDCVQMPREAPDGEECGSADDKATSTLHSTYQKEQVSYIEHLDYTGYLNVKYKNYCSM